MGEKVGDLGGDDLLRVAGAEACAELSMAN